MITRRRFCQSALATSALLGAGLPSFASQPSSATQPATVGKPNIILLMADDQGWHEIGYNGHKYIKTPVLDEMAASGLRMDRFYSAAPICSPTRASIMTGRHPIRSGTTAVHGNKSKPHIKETFLPELLQTQGYATAHIGKWHLGGHMVSRRERAYHPYSRGYDQTFWTANNAPHVDPDNYFIDGKKAGSLKGEDSLILAEKTIAFIRAQHKAEKPFFTTVWFHSPHKVHGTTDEFKKPYENVLDGQHVDYFGQLTALDHAVGMIRKQLRELGIADNTLVWYCSDNGSEYKTGDKVISAHGPKGAKFTLNEGGVLVPGIVEWPDRIKEPATTRVPAVTTDMFATITDLVGVADDKRIISPQDGISLLPLFDGTMKKRGEPIYFANTKNWGVRDDDYIFIAPLEKQAGGMERPVKGDHLYAGTDIQQKKNLANDKPEVVAAFKAQLSKWHESALRSGKGEDYPA